MKIKPLNFKTKVIALSGILTLVSLMLLFEIKGLAPFGTKSLVIADADIQYLDFYSYYKDVLLGKNSIAYSFGKTLGGSNIAVFSYYLSSPFNLLLLFFNNLQLHTFFDIVVALKLSLAAITFSFFCVNRFEHDENDSISVYVLLAVGYGLCQYNIAQSCNIMWLDGVYMLPLILLQVSNLVRGKKVRYMPFLVGATIIFNWYSAGIDCVFSAFWFLFEYSLMEIEKKLGVKYFFRYAFKYIVSMCLGVMMSAALFLPTIGALRKSTRGSLHFETLKDLTFLGQLPSVVQKYTYGASSEKGSVALFCGCLAIVLALSTLFNRRINIRKRALFFTLFVVSVVSFYWQPFLTLFSLFQGVSSYYYRYSYVAVFSILFLALSGYREFREREQAGQFISIAVAFSTVLIILYYINPINELGYVYATALVIVVESALFLCARFTENRSFFKKTVSGIFVALGIIDLIINASILIDNSSSDGVWQYRIYRESQENTIASIKAKDSSFYRISQTAYRGMNESRLTANYNEALSYNYASISGYTSSPDDIQREFLNKLGYPINGENMCVTNTSILGADSLLGVKYVLSPYEIQGLEEIQGKDENGKAVYQNPYAFPMAFIYDDTDFSPEESTNPFEYQNMLYRKLFGLSEDIYNSIEYTISRDEEGCMAKVHLNIFDTSNCVVYGSIPWNTMANASIYADGQFITQYACWLSPSVFYIPNTTGDACEIEVYSDTDVFDWDSLQFYALNLNVLKDCAQIANNHKVENLSIENGCIMANVQNAKEGEQMFLPVPADKDWDISVNGMPADIELIGDCLYSIKLAEGINSITMTYHIHYLKIGILISFFTVLFLCCYIILEWRKSRKMEKLISGS